MGGEESNERSLGIEPEGVVGKVDGVEVREVEEGCQKVGEGRWDFGE